MVYADTDHCQILGCTTIVLISCATGEQTLESVLDIQERPGAIYDVSEVCFVENCRPDHPGGILGTFSQKVSEQSRGSLVPPNSRFLDLDL